MENTNDKHILNFQRARNWLLIMIMATMASCLLFTNGFTFRVPFSANLPIDILYIAGGIALEYADEIYWLSGIIAAFFIILLYLLFWVLSKKSRVLIVFALALFIVDTLFLIDGLSVAIATSTLVVVFLIVATHGWILFCLVKGAIAWSKLRGITYEQYVGDVVRLAKELKYQKK